MDILEILKIISSILGCVLSAITLCSICIKPIRKYVINKISKWSNKELQDKAIQEQNKIIQKQNEAIAKEDKAIGEIKDTMDKIVDIVSELSDRIFRNEADRLRSELFDCGNRCRRGIRLHPEEMDHIRAIYHKYKDVLHQNHEGDAEFDFINQYYNQQSFPAYHSRQND